MDASLKITSNDLSDEDLQDLTHELSMTLNEETEVTATLPEETSEAGNKGDAITLCQILLTALSSGTVVALFNVLIAYLQRKPSLEIEFMRKDGQPFIVRTEHLSKDQLNQTLSLAKDFFGGTE